MEQCIFLNEHLANLLSKKYDLTPETNTKTLLSYTELERDKLCSETRIFARKHPWKINICSFAAETYI